jgi:NOL1/NOP2/sun family putative RNA methylase
MGRASSRPQRRGRDALPDAIAYLRRYADLVDDWPAFVDAMNRPLATCVWANPSRIGPVGLAEILGEDGIESRALAAPGSGLRLAEGLRPGRRWWFVAGLAHIQEAASQVPVHLMDLRPGHRVLDLCAAPGGKTAQIGFALGNRGTLLANDFSTDRIRALQGNLDRLGLVNVTTCCRDAASWPAAAGTFDRILLDAPCSSEGTLRRNPELAGRLGPELSARLSTRQRAMLRKAVQRCRAGGRIVYATCTLAPEENELVVRAVLREFDGRLRLVPAAVPGLVTAPGVTRWRGERLDDELAACVRLWPHHNDTGGFFMAVLEKEGTESAEPEPSPAPLVSEPEPHWVAGLGWHYGVPESLWRRFAVHRQTRRGLHLTAADHAPPALPAGEGSGLFFLRTNIRTPKLTTAGALLLGPWATRQRIELDAGQRDLYLARRELTPTRPQCADLRPGQVLAAYGGFTLGVALYHRSGTLESLFPRRWSG